MVAKRNSREWRIEAECFARYLIGETPQKPYIELYVRALQSHSSKLSEADSRLMHVARQHPWSIGYLDAGLALLRPDAELRRRLHLMLSILETVPEYADDFLPKARPRAYIFVVGWAACKASVKAVVGLALIKLAA